MSILGKRPMLFDDITSKCRKLTFGVNFQIYLTFYNGNDRVVSIEADSSLGKTLLSTDIIINDSILLNIHENLYFHTHFIEDVFLKGYESISGSAIIKSRDKDLNVELRREAIYENEIYKLPDAWELTEKFLKSHYDEIEIEEGSLEYEKVIENFRKSSKINKFEQLIRIQHLKNYLKYQKRTKTFEKTRITYHGTGKTYPLKVSRMGITLGDHTKFGLWGKAIYFAQNSSYSDLFAFRIGNKKTLFQVEVKFQKPYCVPCDSETRKFTSPPDNYDCVIGASYPGSGMIQSTSAIIALYEPDRNLIQYMIKYI